MIGSEHEGMNAPEGLVTFAPIAIMVSPVTGSRRFMSVISIGFPVLTATSALALNGRAICCEIVKWHLSAAPFQLGSAMFDLGLGPDDSAWLNRVAVNIEEV